MRMNDPLHPSVRGQLADLLVQAKAGHLRADPGILAVLFACAVPLTTGPQQQEAARLQRWYEDEVIAWHNWRTEKKARVA